MRPRTLDIVLTAAVFVTSVSESLLSAGVTGPRWAAALLSGAMSLLLLGRRTHPVAMSVALLVLVLPTAAFVVDPSDLISTFFPLLDPRLRRRRVRLAARGRVRARADDRGRRGGRPAQPGLHVGRPLLPGDHRRALLARRPHRPHPRAPRRRAARDRRARRRAARARGAGGGRRGAPPDRARDARRGRAQHQRDGRAGRRRAPHPRAATPSAPRRRRARIRAAGTDALAEMHILLGVLESAPDGAAPPTLDGLEQLVARTRAAGLPVSLDGHRRAPLAQPRRRARRLPRRAGGAHQRHEARGQRDDVRAPRVGRGRARDQRRRPRRRRPEPAAGRRRPRPDGHARAAAGLRRRGARRGRAPEGGFEVAARLPLERATAGVA